MTEHFDIIVIGSGGGNKIAIPAAAGGRKVALIEKDAFGGTCLNRGCIPSKMLIYPAGLLALLREARALNLTGVDQPACDFPALITRCSATVDQVSKTNAAATARVPNLSLIHGTARFCGPRLLSVAGRTLTAPHIVIAAGVRPAPLKIEGAEDVPYMTSREALRRDTLPKRLIVIGASYIATELGFVYATFGSEVQFIVRSRFLRQEDDEISAAFNDAFRRRHATHYGVPEKVSRENGEIRVTCRAKDGRRFCVPGDALLVATGVIANTEDLALEKTGIRVNPNGTIPVDGHLQTSVPGIYALGDCIGRYFFRHTVNFEGEYLMRTALADAPVRDPIGYGPVPHAVFTHPEVAAVGPTERELRAAGSPIIIGHATYAESTPGMARVPGNGFVKVIIDAGSHRLLAAHILGEDAATMLHLFISAMVCNATLEQMLGMIFIHPSLPEVARDALRDARNKLAGS